MLTKSGLTNDQNTMVYSHVTSTSPADAQELTPAKVQATVLKFYDKPWEPYKRDQSASKFLYSRPIIGEDPASSRIPAHTNHVTEGPGENNNDDEKIDDPEDWYYQEVLALSEAWNNGELGGWSGYPDDDDGDIETYSNGGEWLHRDALDVEVFDNILEEECMNDDMMAEAYLGYCEARDVFNQVRRGHGFWPVVAIPIDEAAPPRSQANPKGKSNGKGRGPVPGRGKSFSTPSHTGDKKVRFDAKPSQAQARARATTTAPSSSSSGSLKSRLASQTSCRRCGTTGRPTVLSSWIRRNALVPTSRGLRLLNTSHGHPT